MDSYGSYTDICTDKNILTVNFLNDIPILFSNEIELNEFDDAAFFMLYLNESRKGLNFLEVSIAGHPYHEEFPLFPPHPRYYEEYVAMKVLQALFAIK